MKNNPTKHFRAPREARYTWNGRSILTYRRADLRRLAAMLGVTITEDTRQGIAASIEVMLRVRGVEPGELSNIRIVEMLEPGLMDEDALREHQADIEEAAGPEIRPQPKPEPDFDPFVPEVPVVDGRRDD